MEEERDENVEEDKFETRNMVDDKRIVEKANDEPFFFENKKVFYRSAMSCSCCRLASQE